MRKLFTLILGLMVLAAGAQTYNNEWIDFSKVYYKFKVADSGLYRISKETLNAAGLGNTPAEQFKLFRNGAEVAIYTTVLTGVLPASGFIEFPGVPNDGKPDQPLYRNSRFQHTDRISLQTDTAVYFLTAVPGNNLRMIETPNNVTNNNMPAEPYFMHTAGRYFKEIINPGYAAVIGEYVYSSSYDQGEFWSTQDISPGNPRVLVENNLAVFAGGPAATIRFGVTGNAQNVRSARVSVNGMLVRETAITYFNDSVVQAGVPTSILASNAATVQFTNTSATPTDRMVVSFYELTYPRQFNFGGAKHFAFELGPRTEGYYLEISNFTAGNQPPVLYDVALNQRFTGEVSGNITRFRLPGTSTGRKLVLESLDASNLKTVNSLSSKTFLNLKETANQGNYLIVSNKLLFNGTNGVNPVEQYRLYRSSVPGGSYNARTYDIDELVDQFAFGIKKHPLSVKNFLRFARANFAAPPKFALLLGRGVEYSQYRLNQSDPLADRLNLVPTFGAPGSDNLLATANSLSSQQLTPIGRISAVTAVELEDYLQKVKEYENAQKNSGNTIADRLWMKNAIHLTGASDAYLGTVLCNYMQGYKQIAEDTSSGNNVTVFCKNTTNTVEQLSNDRIAALFQEGLSLVTYFGHSSATTLEFNLDNPQNYNNQGKYPVFSVNGCNAGNFFTFDPQRFTFNETLSEKFVLAKQRGAIAFIASTHFGIVNYLNVYLDAFYRHFSTTKYGSTLGEINSDALNKLVAVSGVTDYYARVHAEEVTIHGDPALVMNFQPQPDYVIEEPQVKINPAFVSVAENKFKLAINIFNLGKAVKDSTTVEVNRQYPNGTIEILFRKKIRGILYSDSVNLEVPVVATRDKGLNKLLISIDADNSVNEISETNNYLTKEFFIYEDEARPAFPYEYSIVNNAGQKLYASTANPFSSLKQYALEIDTAGTFNSPMKVNKTISTTGGVLEFDPGIVYRDSTVYYWRVSLVPPAGETYRWNESSFIYLNGNVTGFNQSHYYQHLKSTTDRISLDADRTWKFAKRVNNLFLKNAVYPTGSPNQADYVNSVNGNNMLGPGCVYDEVIFQVLDGVSFKPWANDFSGTAGLYGSLLSTCGTQREYNFEFALGNAESRKRAMDFLDKIPDGAFVIARSNTNPDNAGNTYSNIWKADTALYGTGNSLYHKLVSHGFSNLDSFNKPAAWIFVFKKNGQSEFPAKTAFTESIYDRITILTDGLTPDTVGTISSPVFGPAKNWKQLRWRGSSLEPNSYDNPVIDIHGRDSSGVETKLYTLDRNQFDFDLSGINAVQYPYIRLQMRNADTVALTPYQLRYWRLEYDAVPEGAVAPNLFLSAKDTLEIGESLDFGVAFKNISQVPFDSLKMKFIITGSDNVAHEFALPRTKRLVSGDTVIFRSRVDTRNFPESNTLYVDFNPGNDQPESYHNNNFLYRSFYVRPDRTNPLMDVTFDGAHILNRDIVSARPRIQIKLKDEARFLLLNDTSLITVQVRFPDPNRTVRTFKFDNDTLRFIPAQTGADNTATIEFTPAFNQQYNEEGDDYELIVTGKDKSGNSAGRNEFRVAFRVISKPMISNLLNYPNPFTTSTAFVFTITGSEIPQNLKIQILTITGKVVREITKDELGGLHIGRNITEFKWDGTDQFGQRLANGVYLYRVVTTMNGRQMEKYKSGEDDTDKYFNRGYGKMYLMR
ncbi:MAG TPA: C25 family cysteine peptidase [Chitinophagaceae bacterium]|nr:C25 family cysteine peptidase [Chitinophagaceae bacterium]